MKEEVNTESTGESDRLLWERYLASGADRSHAGNACPDVNEFAAFLEDRPGNSEREAFLTHLAYCAPCRSRVLELGQILEDQPDRASNATVALRPFGSGRFGKAVKTAVSWAAAVLLAVVAGYSGFSLGADTYAVKEKEQIHSEMSFGLSGESETIPVSVSYPVSHTYPDSDDGEWEE